MTRTAMRTDSIRSRSHATALMKADLTGSTGTCGATGFVADGTGSLIVCWTT